MTQRKPNDIRVYWDKQDRTNEGWAYNCRDDDGMIDSGALESSTLEHAIEEACRILRMTGIENDFTIGQEEGGYGIWNASVSEVSDE